MGKATTTSPETRFWYRVHQQSPTECWLWIGGNNGRYGVLCRGRNGEGMVYAHRLSYEMHIGPIPEGLDVMHACDEPLCVNPLHLSAGTRAENMADAKAKGRISRVARSQGEKNRHAKLTEKDVKAIRLASASGVRMRELVSRFGVKRHAIRRIISRQTWRHVN